MVRIDIEFREIPDWPGYRVGSDGSVWSRKKTNGQWRKMKLFRRASGHLVASFSIKHKTFPYYVHTLVLTCFSGPRPSGSECRHLDGNPGNNFIENLAWGTRAENSEDRRRHGTLMEGDRHYGSILSETLVAEIRNRIRDGEFVADLAGEYGFKYMTILNAAVGRTWRCVNEVSRPVELEKNRWKREGAA